MTFSDQPQVQRRRSPGRPRLYEPDEERDLLRKATVELLRRNADEEMTVGDILEEAGVSTRSFYRHFQTKEDVIRSVYERDAESFGAHLRRRVEAAADPGEALAVWVNEMLSLAYDRRREARMSALGSPMVQRVIAGTRTQQIGVDSLVAPLRSVLEDGLRAGWFPDTQVDLDVYTIKAITMEVIGLVRAGLVRLSRRKAADHILRFSRAALGGPAAINP